MQPEISAQPESGLKPYEATIAPAVASRWLAVPPLQVVEAMTFRRPGGTPAPKWRSKLAIGEAARRRDRSVRTPGVHRGHAVRIMVDWERATLSAFDNAGGGQNGAGSSPELIRILDVLTAVVSLERSPARSVTLQRHADVVLDNANRDIVSPAGLDDIPRRHRRVLPSESVVFLATW